MFTGSCKKEELRVPLAITQKATNLQYYDDIGKAMLNGTINSNFLSTTVTFEYGETIDYGQTIAGLPDTITNDTNTFVHANISGLKKNTTYYFRVKAKNESGITNGNAMTFTLWMDVPGPQVTDVDGNIYNSVKIGTQIWMRENLKTTKFNDVTAIPLVTDSVAWANLTTPGYCWLNNDEASYKNPYGALYNFYTVQTGKLCLTGWHIPTDTEWTILSEYLGGNFIAGDKLKEAGTAHWAAVDIPLNPLDNYSNATNETGFTALPGSGRWFNGNYFSSSLGFCGIWWTSSISDRYIDQARHVGMLYIDRNLHRSQRNKGDGVSIRCLKD